MTEPIAYSYVRFSSKEQAKGDSERRQRDAARAFAFREGLLLDESYETDKGLSAYTGANLKEGAFPQLLNDIRSGKIARGSLLIVESLDRISRLPVKKACKVVDEILEYGVNIYELSENHLYTENEDFTDIIVRLVRAERANNESKQKSQRIGERWSRKKHKSETGIAITGALPAWLQGKTGEPMQVIESRAAIVHQIFEMAAAGLGKRLITRRLNEQKVPTFGDTAYWGYSYVHKILTNRAVLGEYQPHKGRAGNRVPDGEPRLGFYPAIVTPELWDRAKTSVASRRAKTAKGEDTGLFAGRTGGLYNLFAGLVQDATMGLPMHYEDKGKRDRPKLVTACKTINGTRPNVIVYAQFEKAFLNWLDQLDWTTVIDSVDASEIKQAEEDLATLNYSITSTEKQIESVLDLLIDTPSPALKARLGKLEATLAADKRSRIDAEKRLVEVKNKHRDLTDQSIIFAALSTEKDLQTRARLRQEIRRKVSRIEVHFGEVAHSFQGAEALAKVYFINRVERWIAFGAGLAVQVNLDGSVPPTFAI